MLPQRHETYDEKLALPDLEDTLAMPHPIGAIEPVSTVNDAPVRRGDS